MAAEPTPAAESPRQQGISLRELSEAFAQVITGGPNPENSSPSAVPDAGSRDEGPPAASSPLPENPLAPPEPVDIEEAADDAADLCRISPLSVLEAMLFVGNRASGPLCAATAAALIRGVEPDEIPDLVDELNRRYAANRCPYEIVSEGPGYRLSIRRDHAWLRNQFYGRVREARLSRAAIETLAVVAYRQPITADEVTAARGAPSGPLLTQLVRRRLLRIERPPDSPRSARYSTTDRFLTLFGLESLADLPQTDDLEGR